MFRAAAPTMVIMTPMKNIAVKHEVVSVYVPLLFRKGSFSVFALICEVLGTGESTALPAPPALSASGFLPRYALVPMNRGSIVENISIIVH